MSRTLTLYAVVKVTVEVVDDTSSDSIAQRIGEGADYNVSFEDDVCQVKDTEFLDISDTCPV